MFIKLPELKYIEGNGIPGVEVKFVDIRRNTVGEGDYLGIFDTEARKHREQIGLETQVVYALNDEY